MICPVLERLQAMEGGDASDGAGTGTEIDEVRGGLPHPSGRFSQAEAAEVLGVSGAPSGAGAIATRWREPTVSTTAAWAARRGARRWRGCWSCSTPATGTATASTSTRAGRQHGFKRSYNWVRLTLTGTMGAGARRPGVGRTGASGRAGALPGMMLRSGRLEPRVGPRSMVGPDRHHATMRPAISTRPSSSPKRAPCRASRGVSEAIRAKGLFCSLYADRASHFWNTPEAGGRWTRTSRPRSAVRFSSSTSS